MVQTSRSYYYSVESVSFEKCAPAMLQTADIEFWDAKALFYKRQEIQMQLARKSALRHVPVADGLKYLQGIKDICVARDSSAPPLDKDSFMSVWLNLLQRRDGKFVKPGETELISSVFDSMVFDVSDTLSLAECGGGMMVFFEGTQKEKEDALFKLADQDGDGCLSKKELKEYLTSFVNAMTSRCCLIPNEEKSGWSPEVLPLQPLLLEHCAIQIMESMGLKSDAKVSQKQFTQWLSKNIVDSLGDIVEAAIYKAWLTGPGATSDSSERGGQRKGTFRSKISQDRLHCSLCSRRVFLDQSSAICPACQKNGQVCQKNGKVQTDGIVRLVLPSSYGESKLSKQPSSLSDTASTASGSTIDDLETHTMDHQGWVIFDDNGISVNGTNSWYHQAPVDDDNDKSVNSYTLVDKGLVDAPWYTSQESMPSIMNRNIGGKAVGTVESSTIEPNIESPFVLGVATAAGWVSL